MGKALKFQPRATLPWTQLSNLLSNVHECQKTSIHLSKWGHPSLQGKLVSWLRWFLSPGLLAEPRLGLGPWGLWFAKKNAFVNRKDERFLNHGPWLLLKVQQGTLAHRYLLDVIKLSPWIGNIVQPASSKATTLTNTLAIRFYASVQIRHPDEKVVGWSLLWHHTKKLKVHGNSFR